LGLFAAKEFPEESEAVVVFGCHEEEDAGRKQQ
jgi:hypothetical protein